MAKHTLLITGAAGYVGGMLIEQYAKRDDVERIIGIDKDPQPDSLKVESKLVYIQKNTVASWEDKVRELKPDIIIHTAWQIREIYGNRQLTWKWNIEGSDRVFDFAFSEPYVERLIHFSTVASYGAYSTNTLEHRFTEDELFRKMDYLYSEEKRICEEHLQKKYERAKASGRVPEILIVRPAAITGPRGRYMRIRFGLQATLSGQMKGSLAYNIVSAMVSFIPVTKGWVRQFIHEDDVVALIARLAFGDSVGQYEVFNICPPGNVVRGPDMAQAVGKRTILVFPWMVRAAFFTFWHLTRGKIPTGRGAWKSYSYPILVDGSKLTRLTGYKYKFDGKDAFCYTDGEYEEYVPGSSRRSKSGSA